MKLYLFYGIGLFTLLLLAKIPLFVWSTFLISYVTMCAIIKISDEEDNND